MPSASDALWKAPEEGKAVLFCIALLEKEIIV